MGLREIYQKYHDQVQFIMVYIREAHPVDGWWLGSSFIRSVVKFYSPKTSFDTYDPKTIQERQMIARQCETTVNYGIRTVVDTLDDRVSKAYAAKPTRLYLIGIDGTVVYRAKPGPYGFKPGDFEQAIKNYLHVL